MTSGNGLKIAVTGASGFIGRYVLNELISRGVDVVALTRDVSKLSEFLEKCEIRECDISRHEPDVFAQIGKPDILIHLAWGGLPNYKSLHHFETELPVQYRFLKSAIEGGLKTLFVSGTCFEYGMMCGPLHEAMITDPQNPYGYAKDALRRQLTFLKNELDFRLTWARLFYVYGEGQSRTSLFPQLMNAISRKDSVFRMSGGEQLRDYLKVECAAQLIVQLALQMTDVGVINVCSGNPVSVRDIVKSWIKATAQNIELEVGYYSYLSHEPMAFWGDTKKLHAVLYSQRPL